MVSTFNIPINRLMDKAALQAHVAGIARQRLAQLQEEGRAPKIYTRYVDNHKDRPEEQVSLQGGHIDYWFSVIREAALFAYDYAVRRSPRRSGDFRLGWVFMVDGTEWTGKIEDVPAGSEIVLVNNLPYARKIETGGLSVSVSSGLVEATRQAVRRKYPNITAQKKFITLEGGTDARGGQLPYILKKQGMESGLSRLGRKRGKPVRLRTASLSNRRDRAAGQQITYPALVLNEAV